MLIRFSPENIVYFHLLLACSTVTLSSRGQLLKYTTVAKKPDP